MQIDRESFRRTIELRHLDKCSDELPISSSSTFSIKKCSSVLATVAEQEYSFNHAPMEPASTLVVLQLGGVYHFFFQVHHKTYVATHDVRSRLKVTSYQMQLYHVVNRKVSIIHSEPVSVEYLIYARLDHLGGISLFADNYLCWTTVDKLLCATWNGDKAFLSDVRTILNIGEVASHNICEGNIWCKC